MIVTDEQGRPICKPDPADFSNLVDFIRATHAYNDRICELGNQAFDTAFKRALVAKKEK